MARRQSEVRRRFSIAIPRLRVRLLSDLHLHIHFRTCRHSGFESESCSALYGTQTGIKSKQEKNIISVQFLASLAFHAARLKIVAT